MQEEERPDPEALLRAIQESENRREKGRLKIFLGMAAGVGKTYAMLEAAQKKLRESVYVLAGIVNTHGRPETAKLLEHLTVIPERTISYKEIEFKELDVDEIIRLKPQLALVDELAHSNVPGSKHLKRWQDVIEILESGIDVYTTLNVQHIESYKDIVEGITGIQIRETVPDLMLEKATSIACVDITPAELLQRLKEGKVYTGDLSAVALQNFFQEDRLTALREIALRCTAEVVDLELHEMIKAIQRGKGWRPRERLLVAINHHPYSRQLIRAARRLAFTLHAPWSAIYVDDGESLDESQALMLSKNLAFARELGGEVITTQDTDIAQGIQRVAEQNNISQIIVGKSLRKKFFQRSPVERLTKISSGIDVHIIRQSALFPRKKKKIKKKTLSKQALSYLHIFFWIVALSFFNALIVPYVGYRVVGSIFLLSILLLSLFFRRGPIFLAALFFALIWDFYFIPPAESFKITSSEDVGFIVLFFLAAAITGVLTNRARKRQELLHKKEQSTQAIYEIVREISAAPTSADLFRAVKGKLGTILQGACEIVVQKMDGALDFEGCSSLLEDEKEKAVANWVFENGKEAGWSTCTLPSVKNLYIPLKGFKEIVGVLAFRPTVDKPLLPEESNFLYTVAQQLANFLERDFSEERERKNELIQQIEQIYAKVLQSISDELYRPLVVIQNAIVDFKDEKAVTENVKLFTSFQNIEKTADSLMHIAENATAMAKLSGGVVTFEKSFHNVEELINGCVKKIQKSLKQHHVKINVAKSTPPVSFDFSLMTILVHHLLTNAIEYSPPHTTIEVEAEVFDGTFVLSVSDEGKGIPEDMMELVFEKFYRLRGTASTGLGLGLAIVKSIAEMHNGYIKVQNRPVGGTKFSLILPL
jgi:two-component system, OmpR family, sensor histidine kinase KdpD